VYRRRTSGRWRGFRRPILTITTDLEEELRTQVLTDWTSLIKP
jgi:hypothetical protein